MRHSCQTTWENTVENGLQAKQSQRSSFSIKKTENRKTSNSVHWWLSHQRPVRVGLHCQARCDYHPWRQCSLTRGLLFGRSEVLRSLKHYLRTPSQWHHTIDRLEERGVERGSARRSSLKRRERARAFVNQTNIGTVSKATLGKLLRDGVESIIMGFSERIDIILNWTKWTELSQSFERCITVLTVDSLGPVEENFQPLTF